MPARILPAFIALLAVMGASNSLASTVVKICDDEAGWPPYSFVDASNPEKVTGVSVDILTEIFKRSGYQAQFVLLPWKRCLSEVETGATQMLLHASYSDERAQKFLISKPYYSIQSALFYLNSKFPVPPKINSVAEMKKFRYCGLFGYNYTMYDLPESQLDAGTKDEPSRFKKLRLDRCDFILGDVEIIKNFGAKGQIDLSGIGHIPIPGAKPKEFHAMISRATPEGDKLLRIVNDGIAALKADKTYAKILKKYGI